jgi:hypothetical protein
MQAMREAALRPTAADLYPFLPARMWTAAAHLSELVAGYRGVCAQAADRAHRVLSDADFMFRGGDAKRGLPEPPERPGGGLSLGYLRDPFPSDPPCATLR